MKRKVLSHLLSWLTFLFLLSNIFNALQLHDFLNPLTPDPPDKVENHYHSNDANIDDFVFDWSSLCGKFSSLSSLRKCPKIMLRKSADFSYPPSLVSHGTPHFIYNKLWGLT